MDFIEDLAGLEAVYPEAPGGASLTKVRTTITPAYARWIATSRFLILSTVGPEGTDASPRGDDGPVVQVLDPQTIALPDWRGNRRLDSLRNIIRDGRVSLMFLVPGSQNVVRVNGTARVTANAGMTARFEHAGIRPRTVILVTLGEIYFQCAKAVMRSGLWTRGDDTEGLPSAGDFLREADDAFDGEGHDAGYAEHARSRMW